MAVARDTTTELVLADGSGIVLPGTFGKTSLQLPAGLPFEEWDRIGGCLQAVGGRVLWWLGDWLNYGKRVYGERYTEAMEVTSKSYQTLADTAWVANAFEISRRRENLHFTHHREVAALSPDEQDHWLAKAESEEWSTRELRKAVASRNHRSTADVRPPNGLYRTIVIDPPWPIEKIEREVRPNQQAPLDYPTMTLDQIKAGMPEWTGRSVSVLPATSDGCHIYLWTTQRFLDPAFDVMRAWGAKPQCVLVWRKNVGFTPYSFMYDAEFVLFGRIGHLPLLKNGERVVFDGKVQGHSRKPDEFYELVRTVSPEPRIDIFGRREIEGFDSWGNEAPHGV